MRHFYHNYCFQTVHLADYGTKILSQIYMYVFDEKWWCKLLYTVLCAASRWMHWCLTQHWPLLLTARQGSPAFFLHVVIQVDTPSQTFTALSLSRVPETRRLNASVSVLEWRDGWGHVLKQFSFLSRRSKNHKRGVSFSWVSLTFVVQKSYKTTTRVMKALTKTLTTPMRAFSSRGTDAPRRLRMWGRKGWRI